MVEHSPKLLTRNEKATTTIVHSTQTNTCSVDSRTDSHHDDQNDVSGDLLDEGKWCGDNEFQYHVERFNAMFSVPSGTQRHLVVGNHDVGFHYM